LDIFIPSLALAIEYQGVQHYKETFLLGDPKVAASRDKEKKKLCERYGITLLEIPYTWDRTRESILSALVQRRPDLQQSLLAPYITLSLKPL
jgi:hypothetical protein